MKQDLATAVLRAILRADLVRPGDRVGAAVSGGADSVALLRLLAQLRERLGATLTVLHFDHALRADSEGDARFVEELAGSLSLDFIWAREDVARAAALNKWNIEDAARRLRYGFFTRVVESGRVDRIAVAHTMDDQAETVLARLFRGTGPAGLAGIHPVVGAIVRPLLNIRRQDLRDYLRALGQEWREDSTNSDLRRERALIRKKLLPHLEKNHSPRIVRHLAELARLSHEQEAFWSVFVDERFNSLAQRCKNGVVIPVAALLNPLFPSANARREMPSAPPESMLTQRLVRRLYAEVRGSKQGLTSFHVSSVIHLAASLQSGRRIELPGGINAEKNLDEITFTSSRRHGPHKARTGAPSGEETHSTPLTYHHVLALDGRMPAEVPVPELGTCFRLKVIDWSSAERETSVRESSLDFDLLRAPLVLRNWRSGDSYRPHGRRTQCKLKNMFLKGRISSRDRRSWPVLESGGRVVWVRGMAPAEEVCSRKGTRKAIVIEERKL